MNPWGEVIATTSHYPTTVFADIDFSLVDKMRCDATCATPLPVGFERPVNRVCAGGAGHKSR